MKIPAPLTTIGGNVHSQCGENLEDLLQRYVGEGFRKKNHNFVVNTLYRPPLETMETMTEVQVELD